MTFEKFITNKSLNGNSIAKYLNKNSVVLVHERNDTDVSILSYSEREYDNMIDNIPDSIDTLAWMLDHLFDCNMLG